MVQTSSLLAVACTWGNQIVEAVSAFGSFTPSPRTDMYIKVFREGFYCIPGNVPWAACPLNRTFDILNVQHIHGLRQSWSFAFWG